jgi:hypothetical protein
MPSINDQAAADAGRCLDRLIANVNSELTSACMIPITIPKKEMVRLVTESKKWFYKNYEDSVHETYYIVPNQAFQTELFKNKREIPLPGPQADGSGNVISVNELSQAGEFLIGAGNNGFSMDADFTLDKFIFANAYALGGGTTVLGENLMYYVANENLFDMARQVLQSKVSFTYNRLSKTLKILGETPKRNCVLNVYESISDCALYSDEIFHRYIVARCKVQLGTMLMTFSYEMPGKVTLNADMIRDAGQDELDKIKEEIKGDEGVDYFLTS